MGGQAFQKWGEDNETAGEWEVGVRGAMTKCVAIYLARQSE